MGNYKDVKDFFDKNLKVKINKKLVNDLKMFRLEWSTKSDEYIEFMGSNLTGVHNIRFSALDDDKLINDIFMIDDINKLQDDFYNVPGLINKNHNKIKEYRAAVKKLKTGTNVIYQLLVYVIRRILKDKDLSKELKQTGMKEAALIIHYRMFSSLYSHYFTFNVDEHIAVTVYEKLSYKFILKRLNSWGELFEYRVNDVLKRDGVTYTKFLRYTSEDALRIITSIQTKIRSGLLTIYRVLITVKDNKEYITGDSLTYIGGENNEKQVKDVGGVNTAYMNNIKQIKYSAVDFVDRDLINITSDMFGNTVDGDVLYLFLKRMSNQDLHKKIKIKVKRYKKEVDPYDTILMDIMSINFEYLQRLNMNISDRSNIAESLVLIKNYWSSSKVNNKKMEDIKNYLQTMSTITTGRKTRWLVITLALSFAIYVFLRSMKK